jgi:transcriptional regulator with XRE-family HTH domain
MTEQSLPGLDPERQIGRRVRDLRTQLGWSQQKLADQMKALGGRYANWRQGSIDKTERGLRPLRVNEVVDLASVLGVPAEFLFGPLLAGLDAAAIDAQIAETEELLKAAESHFNEVHVHRQELASHLAAAEIEDVASNAELRVIRSTLDALQRYRQGMED